MAIVRCWFCLMLIGYNTSRIQDCVNATYVTATMVSDGSFFLRLEFHLRSDNLHPYISYNHGVEPPKSQQSITVNRYYEIQ